MSELGASGAARLGILYERRIGQASLPPGREGGFTPALRRL